MKSVLWNLLKRPTYLGELNLGRNSFGEETLNSVLFGLLENQAPSLCVLKLDDNTPPLSDRQTDELATGLMRARSNKISEWLVGGGGDAAERDPTGRKNSNPGINPNPASSPTKAALPDQAIPIAAAVVVDHPKVPVRSNTSPYDVAPYEVTPYETSPYKPERKTPEGVGMAESKPSEAGGGGGRKSRGRRSTSEPLPVLASTAEAAAASLEGFQDDKKPAAPALPPPPATPPTPSSPKNTQSNELTVLFAEPLIWRDAKTNKMGAIERLDFEKERDILVQCFKEVSPSERSEHKEEGVR
jgi:hypothetical protein